MSKTMLLLTYTPREDVDLDDYHRWLREEDNEFFNSRPVVRHYTNWRVSENKVGEQDFTHFDLLYVDGEDPYGQVFSDEKIVEFAEDWVRKWGKEPNPDLEDQSVNYQVAVCERIAGPD